MKIFLKKIIRKIFSTLPKGFKAFLAPKILKIKYKRRINLIKKNDISKKNLKKDFVKHENLIKEVFGEIEQNFCESILPPSMLEELMDYLQNERKLSSKDIYKRSREIISKDNKLICTDTSSYGEKLIKDNSKLFNPAWELDYQNPIIIKLQRFIANEFKDYFKSPVIFVNSRAWSMPPNSKPIGPSALHLDGFEDGHLKIMIYPFGLSQDLGGLVIEDKEITNRDKGTLIAFKNSDSVHMSIAGQKKRRIAIEITVMRSILGSVQKNNSHFNGRHYHSIKNIYKIFN